MLTVFSFAVNKTLLKRLKALGTGEYAAQVRWSTQAKPTIGGVSFMAGLIASVLAAIQLFHVPLPSLLSGTLLVVAAFAAFLMGLTDDIRQTRPGSKFIVQIFCGVLLVGAGVVPEGFHPAVQAVLTVFWTVTLMNSVNMLDNMDGVSAGAALPVLLGLSWLSPNSFFGIVSFGMACTLIGFLILNLHPSKLFMGDAGSQLLGFLLAALSLGILNKAGVEAFDLPSLRAASVGATAGWWLLPILFFTTLCDTALVTLNRLLNKRSPFQGGKDHTTHNLSYLGWRDSWIAPLYVFWSAINVVTACFLINSKDEKVGWLLVIFCLISVLIFATFFVISRVNVRRGKYTYK